MHYSIQDFIQLIAQLRNPDGGCPWDLKQNFDSMIPCLTEETYEVIDAIQKKDITNLREELGDLLLQVFGNVTAGNEEEALARWNSIKAQEKSAQKQQSILDNVPNAFPALLRAQKIQKQCSKIGFDWNELEPVFAKVEEELKEVRDEVNQTPRNQERIEEEIGDLFFATVNLSRHLKCNAEEALRKANNKFEQRFRKVEGKALERGVSLKDLSLIEMDILWDEVKKEEK